MSTDYLPKVKVRFSREDRSFGRYYRPETHNYPDQEKRNRYYAYLKHKSQAKYRGETYLLTKEDWFDLWPTELFEQRGRGSQNLCLSRIDPFGDWTVSNVHIITREEFLKKKRKDEVK